MEQKKIHPLVPEAQELLRKGQISRRDFLRLSTLLGLSLASARVLASCAPAPQPAATQPAAAPKIVRGGTLRAATRVERVDHPARFSLVSQSHPWRHVFDYLTYTDPQGITHPYLLEKWEASAARSMPGLAS